MQDLEKSPASILIAADDGYVRKAGLPVHLHLSPKLRKPVYVRLVAVWYQDGVELGKGFAFFDSTMKLSDEMRIKMSTTVTSWVIENLGDRHVEEAHFCNFFGENGYKYIDGGKRKYPFEDLETYLRECNTCKIRYGKGKGILVRKAHHLVVNCRQNIHNLIYNKSKQYMQSPLINNILDFKKCENKSVGEPPTTLVFTNTLKEELDSLKDKFYLSPLDGFFYDG